MDRERQLELLDRIMAHRGTGSTDLAEASYRNPVGQYIDPGRLQSLIGLLFSSSIIVT